jgi:hypothetical protein
MFNETVYKKASNFKVKVGYWTMAGHILNLIDDSTSVPFSLLHRKLEQSSEPYRT